MRIWWNFKNRINKRRKENICVQLKKKKIYMRLWNDINFERNIYIENLTNESGNVSERKYRKIFLLTNNSNYHDCLWREGKKKVFIRAWFNRNSRNWQTSCFLYLRILSRLYTKCLWSRNDFCANWTWMIR